MTWIKICGTTNLEDALMSVDAGADALGFVFYENSPRKVSADLVRDIINRLPEKTEKIGVLRGGWDPQLMQVADECSLTGLQLHAPFGLVEPGQPSAAQSYTTLKRMFLSFSVTDLIGDNAKFKVDFPSFSKVGPERVVNQNPFGTVILDSGTSERPGGTGKTFDWNAAAPLVAEMSKSVKVVVAGGLNPENVAEAIRILTPWGVDVVSGVEASPGKKDPAKVRAFIAAVRQTESTK